MKKLIDFPKIKKAKKAYDKALNAIYVCKEKRDKIMLKTGCKECDIFNANYYGKEMEDRFLYCGGCKHEKIMLAIKAEILEASKTEDLMHKEYARQVFEELKKNKPKLYSRPEKKKIEWDAVFPNNFKDVSNGLCVALVALAEDGIGRYSFAK